MEIGLEKLNSISSFDFVFQRVTFKFVLTLVIIYIVFNMFLGGVEILAVL